MNAVFLLESDRPRLAGSARDLKSGHVGGRQDRLDTHEVTMRYPIWLAATAFLAACSQDRREPAPLESSPSAPAVSDGSSARGADRQDLSCAGPVIPGSTVASLTEQFGSDAAIETLPGPEGTTYEALVVFGDDPARRFEVVFEEDGQATVSSVTIDAGSTRSIAGLRIGDTPAQVEAANGRPFGFYGFSWDYGGNTTDWNGGKLDGLAGGCRVSARFDPRAPDLSPALMGDAELSSDVAGLDRADAHIDQLRLIYPPSGA